MDDAEGGEDYFKLEHIQQENYIEGSCNTLIECYPAVAARDYYTVPHTLPKNGIVPLAPTSLRLRVLFSPTRRGWNTVHVALS